MNELPEHVQAVLDAAIAWATTDDEGIEDSCLDLEDAVRAYREDTK